jgi:hypothetical protein
MRAWSLLASIFISAFANCLASAAADPMTFVISSNGGNCDTCEWVAAQGEITVETPAMFSAFLKSAAASEGGTNFLILLNSTGGNLQAGLELGELIRNSGSSTSVGRTFPMDPKISQGMNYQDNDSGICASACAYTFMGGTERTIPENSKLGVHQFFSKDFKNIDTGLTQQLVAQVLLFTLRMGINPNVTVIASGTDSQSIYWFSQNDLLSYHLVTDTIGVDPWHLEPYGRGLVLSTQEHFGTARTERTVSITLFCRLPARRWSLLLSENNAFMAHQFNGEQIFRNFDAPLTPTITLDGRGIPLQESDIEFQKIADDAFSVSIRLPNTIPNMAGKTIDFEPNLGRVMSNILMASFALPGAPWISALGRNCI